MYVEDLERPFLEASTVELSKEAAGVLSRTDSIEYLKFAEARMDQERSRTALLLHPSTVPKIMDVLETVLIAKNAVSRDGLDWIV